MSIKGYDTQFYPYFFYENVQLWGNIEIWIFIEK